MARPIIKVTTILSAFPVVVFAMFSLLVQFGALQIEISVLLVLYLLLAIAHWQLKRWGVYVYTVAFLGGLVISYMLWGQQDRLMGLSFWPNEIGLFLMPTCLVVAGWLNISIMKPVDIKDPIVILTIATVIVAIAGLPLLRITPYRGGY